MRLTSGDFSDGAAIPRRFTCDGEDLSPSLEWSGAPAAARSFVLLCHDPDAPGGTWHHWAAYDIPADQTHLTQGAGRHREGDDVKQAINDFQRSGYGGPCPPPRHGPHHYRFHLLALSIGHLPLGDKPTCRDVEREARKHVISEATLVGLYAR